MYFRKRVKVSAKKKYKIRFFIGHADCFYSHGVLCGEPFGIPKACVFKMLFVETHVLFTKTRIRQAEKDGL